MKGPYERLKYDLRRLWECPVCKRRERTSGAVTFRHCTCAAKEGKQPVVMQLIADGPQRLVPPILAAKGQCSESAAPTENALTMGQGDSQPDPELPADSAAESEVGGDSP